MINWELTHSPLGAPLPASPHATSVSLPTWQDVLRYEEKDPEVIGALRSGYPRFFHHSALRKLNQKAEEQHAKSGERALVFPSAASAARCGQFIEGDGASSLRCENIGYADLTALLMPSASFESAFMYLRHSGELVSSRLAQAALENRPVVRQADVERRLRERLAAAAAGISDDTYLFPTGMAAIFTAHRAVTELFPSRRTLQLGFAYVDSLRVQEKCGTGCLFLSPWDDSQWSKLQTILRREDFAAIFCEVPSNPLLKTAPIDRLAELAQAHQIPLVLDDTSASSINITVLPYADILTSSLTKYFSGYGDVIAGSLMINPSSSFAEGLRKIVTSKDTPSLWQEDAVVLERNSRDYRERVLKASQCCFEIVDRFKNCPQIESIAYPALTDRPAFDRIRTSHGGYGALFSLVLRDGPRRTEAFYNALALCKGPSFGTVFTLICPFTLLAHYHELDWAEAHGASRHLIRFSIGLEPVNEIAERIQSALNVVA